MGIDILDPFSKATGSRKFIIVAVDHFSKWAEAETVNPSPHSRPSHLSVKNIFTCFEISKVVITDNGTQFMSFKFEDFCRKWDINLRFKSAYYL